MSNNRLNLQYLTYALEVERAGSISKAAENLYMNQPNLSKAIKELEVMIGVTIFERTTKGVSATTEDGRIFLEYAKNIVSQFNNMRCHFQAANTERRVLRVSIPRASYILEAFSSFVGEIEDKGDFYITLQETNFSEAIKSVAEDGYNFAIIRYRTAYENLFHSFVSDRELEHKVLLESESLVLMSGKNRLASKNSLELSDLCDMIEIVNDDLAPPRRLLSEKQRVDLSMCSKRQILVYERGSQFDLLTGNPNTFMWVSPIPQNVLLRNSLVQKKCNVKDMVIRDVLIYRKGHSFNLWEREFLENIEFMKKSILHGGGI